MHQSGVKVADIEISGIDYRLDGLVPGLEYQLSLWSIGENGALSGEPARISEFTRSLLSILYLNATLKKCVMQKSYENMTYEIITTVIMKNFVFILKTIVIIINIVIT